jgi:hypothetical protein
MSRKTKKVVCRASQRKVFSTSFERSSFSTATGFIDNGAGNFRAELLQRLVVTQLTTNDIRGSKCFVRLRAADNGLLGPIAILIVLVRVLCVGA